MITSEHSFITYQLWVSKAMDLWTFLFFISSSGKSTFGSHHLGQFWTLSSPQKETPCPSAVTPQYPESSSPRQLLIYFLFLWIWLFWTFHISGIIQHLILCVWLLSLSLMFSRFTCGLCQIIFHCMAIPRFVYPLILLMNFWIVSALGLLWIMLLRTFTDKILYGHVFSFLLGRFLWVELLDHMVTFDCSHPMGVACCLLGVLICISLRTTDVEHLFMC